MHFHLPKPLHGWREFAGEVGIIVIGVLIALGAEQGVEAVHWHYQVQEARDALGYEIADSIGQSDERLVFSPCLDKRLDDIAIMVSGSFRSGHLPPVGAIGGPPYRTWLTNVWATTMAGQIASHFRRYDLTQLGDFYEFVRHADAESRTEMSDWSTLRSIVGPGRPVTSDEAALLLRTVEDARRANRLISISAVRMRELADRAPLEYDRPAANAYGRASISNVPVCRPIPPPTASSYGVAQPSSNVADLPKTSPLSIH
jgi:hypothetical protein